MKKSQKILCAVLASLIAASLVLWPYTKTVPDMVRVGVNYLSLSRDKNAISRSELKGELEKAGDRGHPFVLANAEQFDRARKEYAEKSFTPYTQKLSDYVFANAEGLLDTAAYPVIPYELDEENSILPISREVTNRVIILGYAWQVSGEEKYAERAWRELENVCSYPDWRPQHFLAAAEMALAVSIGYDWFYDYLRGWQKDLLRTTAWTYAIEPALSKNYLKNWFTWSKNNWNSICYSGIGIACMTFADRDTDGNAENAAAGFLAKCYKNMPIAFANFTPDGVYAEGPGYCESGMNAIVYFIATSRNYFGSDFGMSEIDGFEQLGSFPVLTTSPAGVFNFGDNKDGKCYTPVLHWYASNYKRPLLSVYQMESVPGEFVPDTASGATERNGFGKECALSSLWYDRVYAAGSGDFDGEPLALLLRSDAGQALALMRSGYLDANETYAAVKGGYNNINHADLDIGDFVFDSQSVRWAEELGPGRYDAPGYFLNLPHGGRWKNYVKRAEGQNTLLINPSMHREDQYALARADFESFEETSDGAKCLLDMTDAYIMNRAKSVTREFELYGGRTSLRITDRIRCKSESEIYWFMHTKADIKISEDGKTALMTLGGRQMTATLCEDGEFSVMKAEKLSGAYEFDGEYPDLQKLTVHLKNVKEAVICVTLEPVIAALP